MKFLTLFLALLSPVAQAATLEIVNNSAHRADIGEWKGTKAPSICEDFKFCWVEVNVKFRPAPGLANIRGEKAVELAKGQMINLYLNGAGAGTYNIVESCRDIQPERRGYYFQLNGEARLSEIHYLSVCLVGDRARLVIDNDL